MSDAKFEHCVREIVTSHAGRVEEFRHVGHGFSQARIEWGNKREKRAIVDDLDATEIPDADVERGGDERADGSPG